MKSFLLAALTLLLSTHVCAQTDSIRNDFIRLGYPQYQNCHVTLLPNGHEKFEHMLSGIRSARHFVFIEYYKLWNDSIGRTVMDALAERASKGVLVRVIYDAFGNSGKKPACTPEFLSHYSNLGIDIRPFDPMRFPYVNHALHRLHRKMVIIDGRMVYTGGMNVADYYIHGKPELGRWCDMHACFQGPIVEGYMQLFADMWSQVAKQKISTAMIPDLQDDGYEAFLVDRQPGQKSSAIRDSYVACLDRAQRYVRIVNPYVMLSHSVRQAMRRALKRGVRLEFLVGIKGDNILSFTGTVRELHNLMKRGAVVWFYEGGFHHDKIIIVDDSLCSIGTANLDARSLCFDYEVNAFFFSNDLSSQLNAYFEREKASSILLTEDNWKTLFTRRQRRIGWWTKGLRSIL